MDKITNVVIIQTAFLGDLVLTLPLIQILKKQFPHCQIDLVGRADAVPVLENHPALRRIIPYDKRGKDSGLRGFLRILSAVRQGHYDLAIIPHRSLRSAALARMAGIPRRVGFDRSAGRVLLNGIVAYNPAVHEYRRNLDLLRAVGPPWDEVEYPCLYPGAADRDAVDRFLRLHPALSKAMVAVAPGTLWNTKRWLPERFSTAAAELSKRGWGIVLIGGRADRELCDDIALRAGTGGVVSAAGMLTPLQSAELIRRCRLLISNDSAPLHLAVGVGTPVAAIFGATTPSIGFAPYGPADRIIEATGLTCRPCSIHGGERCPIGTFDCMNNIDAGVVVRTALEILGPGPDSNLHP